MRTCWAAATTTTCPLSGPGGGRRGGEEGVEASVGGELGGAAGALADVLPDRAALGFGQLTVEEGRKGLRGQARGSPRACLDAGASRFVAYRNRRRTPG